MIKVKGSVLDYEYRLLPGVNVEALGEQRYTTADNDGRFEIDVKSNNTQLRFTHAGYDYDTKKAGDFFLDSTMILFPTELDGAIVQNNYKKSKSSSSLWILGILGVAGAYLYTQNQPKKVKI